MAEHEESSFAAGQYDPDTFVGHAGKTNDNEVWLSIISGMLGTRIVVYCVD